MGLNKKRIWNFFGMTWFAVVLAFGSYLMFQDATLDKDKLDHYTGKIVENGITDHNSSTKYGTKTSKVFFFKLQDLDQVLAVYNTGQDYGQFTEKLKTGDVVDVYYKASSKTDEPNIDVYQIEKAGEIILSDKEYRGKRKIMGVICALAVGLVITIGVFKDKRYWKSRREKKYGSQQWL